MEQRDPGDGSSYINLLLWGLAKSAGKTTAAASAPGISVLWNLEQENSTRFAHSRDTEKRLIEPKVPPYAEGTHPIWDLMTEISLGARDKAWDNVIIDTVGELYRRLLDEFSGRATNPSMPVRLDCTVKLERFLRYLVEAPVNLIVVSHSMTVEGADDTGSVQMPLVSSKGGSESGLGPKLAGIVDVIAYCGSMEVEGEGRQYMAQIMADPARNNGTRFPELEPEGGMLYRKLDLPEWWKLANIKMNNVAQTLEAVAP